MSRKKKYAEYPDGWPEYRILYTEGSCFEPMGQPHHYILNPVNNVGTIETTVCQTIAYKWPHIYDYYVNRDKPLGAVHFNGIDGDKTIVTMIVQDGLHDSIERNTRFDYELFRACLYKILFITQGTGTYHMTKPRVTIPIAPWKYPVGDWLKIAKIIDETLIAAKSTVYVYKQDWRI